MLTTNFSKMLVALVAMSNNGRVWSSSLCGSLQGARLKYGESKAYLQNRSLNNRWLTGGRSGIKLDDGTVVSDPLFVFSDNLFQDSWSNGAPIDEIQSSYKWIFKSNPGSGQGGISDRDSKAGECVRYGDKVYLQVNPDFEKRRWLRGGGGDGDHFVDHFVGTENVYSDPGGSTGNVKEHYEWIVRSALNRNGNRSDPDGKAGECVTFGDKIYLQVNNRDRRWLVGGGGTDVFVGTQDIVTDPRQATYEWIVRSTHGNGDIWDKEPTLDCVNPSTTNPQDVTNPPTTLAPHTMPEDVTWEFCFDCSHPIAAYDGTADEILVQWFDEKRDYLGGFTSSLDHCATTRCAEVTAPGLNVGMVSLEFQGHDALLVDHAYLKIKGAVERTSFDAHGGKAWCLSRDVDDYLLGWEPFVDNKVGCLDSWYFVKGGGICEDASC